MRTPAIKTPLDDTYVYLIKTEEDREAFWHWLSEQDALAFDTETEGLGFHDPVRLLQFGNTREAWVLDPHDNPDIVETVFTHSAAWDKLVAHNAAFDVIAIGRMLYRDNPTMLIEFVENIVEECYDTQIMSHLVDPRDGRDGGIGHSLKPLCDHYLGAGAIDGQTALKTKIRSLGLNMNTAWKQIDLWDEDYVLDAGLDASLTARLEEILVEKVFTELELGEQFNFDSKVAGICAGMTARGVRVDMAAAKSTLAALTGEEVTARQNAAFYGVANVNSTRQVAEALLVRGVELTEKTESGQWKVDKEILSSLNDPLAKSVIACKAAGKAMKSWVEPILTQGGILGRVHARIAALRARTGRMSISEPALQQLPTDDYRIRDCLIADEGMVIIAADYDQIEVRVMAYLAGEDAIISAIKSGVDVHSSVAESLYGSRFTPQQRSLAKGAVFAKLYGASPKRLAAQTGVDEMEAKKVMAALDRNYPRLARWSKNTIEKARFHGGFMKTPSGRRLPVDRGHEYKLVNHLVQGTAADIFKNGMIEVHKEYGHLLLLPVHDELIMQVTEGKADEIGAHVCELMGGVLGEVPITAGYKIAGRSWGDAYRPKEAQVA